MANTPRFFSDPPESIKSIVWQTCSRAGTGVRVSREHLTVEERSELDAHAASVAGVHQCEVIYIDGCGSCCNDEKKANLVETDCGPQCWTCANDPCG